MHVNIKDLRDYLNRNRHYFSRLIADICKLFWWKLIRRKTAVITTGSGGIGDYLWIRSYLPLLKQYGYKVILIAITSSKVIVEAFDRKNYDIVRFFESCINPRRLESLPFRLFKSNVFLNFSRRSISVFVRSDIEYNDSSFDFENTFYREINNAIFEQFQPPPIDFSHSIPVLSPPQETMLLLNDKYVVLTEGGNTHGRFTDLQLQSIIHCLTNLDYKILFNGNYSRVIKIVSIQEQKSIINGGLFSFPQYTYVIKNAAFVVTVNTSIYHFAILLNTPIVIVTPYEPHTVLLNDPMQQYVFNDRESPTDNPSLRTNEEKNALLVNTDPEEIVMAIKRMQAQIEENHRG